MNLDSLQKQLNFPPYFWNGLFAVIRSKKLITCSHIKLAQTFNISQTTFYNYLSCTQLLTHEDFMRMYATLSEHQKIRPDEELLYMNLALAYLEENASLTGTLSKSKIARKQFIDKAEFELSEDYIDYQESLLCNLIEADIQKEWENCSVNELSYMYEIASILPMLNNYDRMFIDGYIRLTTNGKSLFKEALIMESSEPSEKYEDASIVSFREISHISKDLLQETITPQMLSDKLFNLGTASIESAQILRFLLSMNKEDWNVLINFHRIVLTYDESQVSDEPINQKQSLILFLDWLCLLPSLITK